MDFSQVLGSLKECERPGCTTKFIPQPGKKRFCSNGCAGNANARRRPAAIPAPPSKKARFTPGKQQKTSTPTNSNASAVCLHPMKMVFPNTDAAWDWIEENHEGDELMQPYTCRCGAIHIGHGRTKVTREVVTTPNV